VLRRPETRRGLNSGLTQQARRDQTGKNAMPLSPKPQVAGSIPVPPAPHECWIYLGCSHMACSLFFVR
jgi:hypothetical protein